MDSPSTYDHTYQRTRDPVRSPLDKLVRARLVVGSVTTSESLVLYAFFGWVFIASTTTPGGVELFWEAVGLPHLVDLGMNRRLCSSVTALLTLDHVFHRKFRGVSHLIASPNKASASSSLRTIPLFPSIPGKKTSPSPYHSVDCAKSPHITEALRVLVSKSHNSDQCCVPGSSRWWAESPASGNGGCTKLASIPRKLSIELEKGNVGRKEIGLKVHWKNGSTIAGSGG